MEAKISPIKRCLGATLLTQKIAAQQGEGAIIANIINLWKTFALGVAVASALTVTGPRLTRSGP